MLEKQIEINSKKIGVILLGLDVLICCLSTALWYFPRKYQIPVANLDELFYLDNEQNVPTFYSVLLILLATGLTIFVAKLKKNTGDPFYPHWTGLSIGMFLLASDEFIMLHEKLKRLTFRLFPQDSFLYSSSWVTIGAIIVIILGLFFIRFMYRLPKRTKIIFVISGIIYITGALILERIGFSILDIYGRKREFILITMLEEFMEMGGITLYIYGLLEYLKDMMLTVKITYLPTPIKS